MAITARKIRKIISGIVPKAPNKRESAILLRSAFLSDVQTPTAAGRYLLGEHTAMYVYDFAVDGGAHGTAITPVATVTLPANAIITGAWMHVITACTGATATVSADCNGAGDLVAATAVASLTTNAIIIGAANTTPIRASADKTLTVTIATADLTAGKVRVYVKYFYPDV